MSAKTDKDKAFLHEAWQMMKGSEGYLLAALLWTCVTCVAAVAVLLVITALL